MIEYEDYTGSWTLNSTIHIKVKFWGGETKYVLKIKSINDKLLIVEESLQIEE